MEVYMCINRKHQLHYYTSDEFYNRINVNITNIEPNAYALVSLDFDNFNFINDLFGYEIGDIILYKIEEHFSNGLNEGEFFSRIHADHFVFWVKVDEKNSLITRFLNLTDIKQELKDILPTHYNLVCSGGIIFVNDNSCDSSCLSDKANFARKQAKGNYISTFLYYNKELTEELEWKKKITLTMEESLNNREFEMYLQPKVLIKTNQLVGAEALVRWNSKKYGLIYPDKFIPVFEQNGFIKHLDFFMLEEACIFIKKSIDRGVTPLPISVNFSKVHIGTKNFVEKVFRTLNIYDVPTKLIEIEFTESIFSNNLKSLVTTLSALKALGFTVSLDDFGRAYSSLNCLKDLPIDIVKIDKDFLNSSSNTDKGRIIIAKVIEMIRALKLVSVMEGIETKEQECFLNSLNCDLGQGYLYAKPMTIPEYMKFIEGNLYIEKPNNITPCCPTIESDKSYLDIIPRDFQMDSWELYNLSQNIDMGLMKGYLDGEATVQYVNDKVLEYLGYTRQEFKEIFNNKITAFSHPDDVNAIKAATKKLISTNTPLQFKCRAIRKDGKVIFLHGRASCVIDYAGKPIGVYAFKDVTDELENAERLRNSLEEKIVELKALVESERKSHKALKLSEEKYRLIIDQIDDVIFEWDFATDSITFSYKLERIFGQEPVKYNFKSNPLIRNRIHPEDLYIFEQWIESIYKHSTTSQVELRCKSYNNDYIWFRSKATTIFNNLGEPIKAICVLTDITKQKTKIATLVRKAELDPLTQLYNKEETKHHIKDYISSDGYNKFSAFFIVDIDNFKGVNDNLGHQFGDTVLQETSSEIQKIFNPTDILGRIGGDEIAIFMKDAISIENIKLKAELLNTNLRKTYFGENTKYTISASIGVAYYPIHGKTFRDLYKMADTALYESKFKGKDCYSIYNEHMNSVAKNNITPFECSKRFLNTYFSGDPIFNIFEMLYETKDIKTTINMILEQVGKKFKVHRVYIFENDPNGLYINNTYEWCAPKITSEIDSLQNLSIKEFIPFLSKYNSEGIFCCSDIEALDSLSFQTLYRQGIKSFLQCAICNDGKMVGFIGFDDCSKKRIWHGDEVATLAYISRILSVFMVKNNTSLELLESYKNHMEMLDNLNGYVYVIDPTTYKILYLN